MSKQDSMTAGFDAEDMAVLSTLQDQGEDGDITSMPTASAPAPAPAAAPAPAPAQAAAPAPAPAAAAPAAAPAEAPKTDDLEPANKRALRAARRGEERALSEVERLQAEVAAKDALLEKARAGEPLDITDDTSGISDAELEEMRQDFPAQYKIVMNQRRLESELAELRGKQAPAGDNTEEFVPATYAPAVQALIDGNPDLFKWQYDPASQDKFMKAVQYDTALRADPDWATKTASERFVEAARRTKAAMGDSPTQTAEQIAAARLAEAQAGMGSGPTGISDFRGGAPGHAPTKDFSKMSDEQVMQSLVPED